jgi:predicted regulator of Ras-like GTPase activity (Roadblock/LC7/MglB family)
MPVSPLSAAVPTSMPAQQPQPPAPAVPETSVLVEKSVPPPPPVEVEGLGRLDVHSEAAEAGPSQIGAIGKFLLDRQDILNLEKLAQSNLIETGLRVLTPEAAQDLQALLQRIRVAPDVMGSVIVGHDGIMVSNDLPSEVDADSIAVWSLGIYLNTDNAIKKMGRNSVNKLIAKTSKGYLAIADFGAGILATVTSEPKTETLVGVMNVINELVSSS